MRLPITIFGGLARCFGERSRATGCDVDVDRDWLYGTASKGMTELDLGVHDGDPDVFDVDCGSSIIEVSHGVVLCRLVEPDGENASCRCEAN